MSIRVMRGEWPAQRSIAGLRPAARDADREPWNVGDGVREYASGGMQACAETAKLVVERILGTPAPAAPS